MLPPFHGEALGRWRGDIAELAHAELDGWRPGTPVRAHARMQALTLDVILRVVFGAGDHAPLRGVDPSRAGHDRVAAAARGDVARAQRARPVGRVPARGPRGRRAALPRDRRRSRAGIAARRAARRGRRRRPAQPRRAARPGRHAAGRRPRDDRGLARLGARAARPPPGRAGPASRRRRGLPRGHREGGAARAARALDRRPPRPRAVRRRRAHAPAGSACGAVHLPRAPAPAGMAGADRLPARALPRRRARALHLPPVRRRSAPLHRRRVRHAGDEGGAARGRRSASSCGRPGPAASACGAVR